METKNSFKSDKLILFRFFSKLSFENSLVFFSIEGITMNVLTSDLFQEIQMTPLLRRVFKKFRNSSSYTQLMNFPHVLKYQDDAIHTKKRKGGEGAIKIK